MNYLRPLFRLSFFIIVFITFMIGGFLQLFLGIPNIILTYISVAIMLFFIIVYFLFKNRIVLNKTVSALLFFGSLIIYSGIINSTNILKILLYLLFFLLPISTYLFFRINNKESYISQIYLNKLFFYIAVVQLPLMILQKYTYPLLIQLNRSNQGIIEADIMFGSFFLKADHALGLFLLFTIFNIIKNNKNKELTKYPIFSFIYLGLTILISESNLTKLILFIIAGYYIYRIVPKKIKIVGILASIILMASFFKTLTQIPAVSGEIYFAKNEYNVEKSYSNYNRGIAKRGQVVITYFNKLPLKYFGDGPYSYFNILTGKFFKTQHFSQLIWTYADLGLFGLLTIIYILFRIVKLMSIPKGMTLFIFIIFLAYAFMTTVFSDLAIMITCLSIFQSHNQNKKNEYSYSSIS